MATEHTEGLFCDVPFDAFSDAFDTRIQCNRLAGHEGPHQYSNLMANGGGLMVTWGCEA